MEKNTKEAIKNSAPWICGTIIFMIILHIISHGNKVPLFIAYPTVLYMVTCTFVSSVIFCKKFPYVWLWIDKKIKEIWGNDGKG